MQETFETGVKYPEIDMDRLEIELVFKTAAYKEIKQDRAFNIESFIGNVGGYVGLFLGFAIWSIPEIFSNLKCSKMFKNIF